MRILSGHVAYFLLSSADMCTPMPLCGERPADAPMPVCTVLEVPSDLLVGS